MDGNVFRGPPAVGKGHAFTREEPRLYLGEAIKLSNRQQGYSSIPLEQTRLEILADG